MTTIKEIASHFTEIKPRLYNLARAVQAIETKIGKPLMSCEFEDGGGFSFNYQVLGEVGSKRYWIRL